MGGATAHKGGELQVVQTPGSARLFAAPAVLHDGSNTSMFVADGSGTAAWSFSNGKLQSMWQNGTGWHQPGDRWWPAVRLQSEGRSGGVRTGTGKQVASLDAGGGHWNSPIIVDGRIALPEGSANDHSTSGTLDIWRVK